MQELLPAPDMEFKKAEELSIFFQVYNSGLDAAGKPNLTLEYEFHKAEGTGEKFFNKTNPQTVNARQPAAAVRPGQVPGPRRHHGPAGLVRRRRLPPEREDHGQGEQQQGPVPGHQVHRQGLERPPEPGLATDSLAAPVTGVD